jgi:hypothetical protein
MRDKTISWKSSSPHPIGWSGMMDKGGWKGQVGQNRMERMDRIE